MAAQVALEIEIGVLVALVGGARGAGEGRDAGLIELV